MHGEGTVAPGHLHEVVRWVRGGHELSQCRVAEDGVVREADGGDVEVDHLRAEVVVGAEGYWEPDLSQGGPVAVLTVGDGGRRGRPPASAAGATRARWASYMD